MWSAHEVDGRIAAKNAVKIRAALRNSIDARRVFENYLTTQPNVSDNEGQDRARARAWALLNLRINNESLKQALMRLYGEAWVTGDLVAQQEIQIAQSEQSKSADITKAEDEVMIIDWDTWQPGDAASAMLLDPPKAFQDLVSRSGNLITGLDKTGYELIGTALADSIRLGLSPSRAAKRINETIGNPARALTIAVTESSRVMNASAMNRYKASGIKQHKWMPVLAVAGGGVACERCAQNTGQVVEIGASFNSGNTQPPAHPHCRCNLQPVLPDYSELFDKDGNYVAPPVNQNGVTDIVSKKPKPINIDDPNELYDQMTYQRRQNFWAKEVPFDQEEALFSYTSNSYLNMQSVARTGQVALDSSSPERIAKIMKANKDLSDLIISAPPLPTDTLTFRGVQGNIADAFLKAKPGDIITDKGFSSTSLLREKAEIYINTPLPGSLAVSKDTAILEIINPAGTKGIMVEAFQDDIIPSDKIITNPLSSAKNTRAQYEWLLNSNTSFEVVSVNGSTVTVRVK
jgi:SPP1 gp7 family putative phage head morphogenesis protein